MTVTVPRPLAVWHGLRALSVPRSGRLAAAAAAAGPTPRAVIMMAAAVTTDDVEPGPVGLAGDILIIDHDLAAGVAGGRRRCDTRDTGISKHTFNYS